MRLAPVELFLGDFYCITPALREPQVCTQRPHLLQVCNIPAGIRREFHKGIGKCLRPFDLGRAPGMGNLGHRHARAVAKIKYGRGFFRQLVQLGQPLCQRCSLGRMLGPLVELGLCGGCTFTVPKCPHLGCQLEKAPRAPYVFQAFGLNSSLQCSYPGIVMVVQTSSQRRVFAPFIKYDDEGGFSQPQG